VSPRSAKRAPAKAGRGKPLPKPLAASLTVAEKENIFNALGAIHFRLDNLPLTSAKEEMKSQLGSEYPFSNAASNKFTTAAPVQSVAIKDRLGVLCERQAMLLNRLQSSRSYLFGNDSPATGAEIAKPYSLPEHLDQLEMLLDSCLNNFDAISSRF
jgi:hypothetical protein